MKKITAFFILLFASFCFAQQKQFELKWQGTTTLQTALGNIEVPHFSSKNFTYSETKGLTFFAQWQSANVANTNTAQLTNITYQTISEADLKDLDKTKIPSQPNLQFYNTNARGKRSCYIEVSPIVKQNGVYKKIKSFNVNYSFSVQASTNTSRNSTITNSVLSTGQWYKFYVEKSGVYRLSKSFLSNLGVNTNVDPRTIKIYGNGGRMLPLSNAANYPFDVVENAVKFVGEDDGIFNNDDYILFYAEGPDTLSEESDTNINLYTDKTYYYINVSSGIGKRIQPMPSITAAPDIEITSFEDYQYYEKDERNIANIGRRWYGDVFDVETQRTYTFNFPNLITTSPVNFRYSFGSVANSATTMSVTINGNQVANLALPEANLSTSLANHLIADNNITNASGDITMVLDYNNNGNPSASAYLDYIRVSAMRQLTFEGEQLLFKNSQVNNVSGVAQYTLSNTQAVAEVWDISDRFNVTTFENSDNQSTLSFKTEAGITKTFLAFSNANIMQPLRDANTVVQNQNLKGTIFNNAQGQFQDIDYLIITPNYLKSEAERLAQINQTHNNLNVKVVDLESIYSEFSTGSQDIAAIRNFVKYVYDNASSNANRLKYLCLFGDATYDYKNRIRNNNNVVPSWYTMDSGSLTASFISDDFYGMMDTNEGAMAVSDRLDIAVGRMLVNNLLQAKQMVDKVDTYYKEAAYGSWRNNFIVISDDIDIAWERLIQETTEEIATDVEAEKPFMNVVRIHSDAFQQEASAAGDRYPKVNKAIKDAMEVGASVVNYFGHGGEDGIAKERIFDALDAQTVNNVCKYNCFVTVTCELTKFDNPNRPTTGEYFYWNANGGATSLVTTTRQIFVTVGIGFNKIFDNYVLAYGSNNYPSIAEALRLTKADNSIAGQQQKRLVFYIGDPAMKLPIPKPDIRLTQINNVPITQPTDTLKALAPAKLSGQIVDENGTLLSNYNGVLTATVFDKPISRQTLANDNISDNGQIIKLDFNTLGEIIFKGQATIQNGEFEFNFIVPRDIGVPVGNGKVSFYAKANNQLADNSGANFDVKIGGVNQNAAEDNVGPVIQLFMNDENFVSGGITSESPSLLAKLQDNNGINTASGIGHDITAIIDGDETNPIILNAYYQANIDDFTNGTVSYPFRDLEPGLHTLTLKAWDVYNNSSTAEIQFRVFDKDESLVIENILNYPNPFVNYTEFWFNHNSPDPLDVSVQIFTVSGKLVRTINGQTTNGNCCSGGASALSRSIVWDGRDDFGDKIGKGVYIYKLKVKSNLLNKQVEKIEKLVIL